MKTTIGKLAVTLLASAALALTFTACSSDDDKGGGYLSCSDAEEVAIQCDKEAKEARSEAQATCGNNSDCLDLVQDDTEIKCQITRGLCDGDANKGAHENKDAILKCYSYYREECNWN